MARKRSKANYLIGSPSWGQSSTTSSAHRALGCKSCHAPEIGLPNEMTRHQVLRAVRKRPSRRSKLCVLVTSPGRPKRRRQRTRRGLRCQRRPVVRSVACGRRCRSGPPGCRRRRRPRRCVWCGCYRRPTTTTGPNVANGRAVEGAACGAIARAASVGRAGTAARAGQAARKVAGGGWHEPGRQVDNGSLAARRLIPKFRPLISNAAESVHSPALA
jgi:hypothetical protein